MDTDAPALAALEEHYPDFHFRKNGKLWVATRRRDHPFLAPTLIEDSLPQLTEALRCPPGRAAKPFSAVHP